MVDVRKRDGSLFGDVSDTHAVELMQKGWVIPVRSPVGKLRFVTLSAAAEALLASASTKAQSTEVGQSRACGFASYTVASDGDRRSHRNYRHINARCFRWRLTEARNDSLRGG